MSGRAAKRILSEDQITAQESSIPNIAGKAFSNAYRAAIANGASVLIVEHGELLKVTKDTREHIRTVGVYGTLPVGTHLKVSKKAMQA